MIHLHRGSTSDFPLPPSRPGHNTAGENQVRPNSFADIIQDPEVLRKKIMKYLFSICKKMGQDAGETPGVSGFTAGKKLCIMEPKKRAGPSVSAPAGRDYHYAEG